MRERDFRTIASAAALIAVGLFAVLFASARYAIGTMHQIGPGMFPIMLGTILTALGLAIAFQAVFRAPVPYERLPLDARALIVTAAALAGFALSVARFGVVPAIVVLVVVMSLLQERIRPLRALLLATALSVIAIVVFQTILGVPFRFFDWPFR